MASTVFSPPRPNAASLVAPGVSPYLRFAGVNCPVTKDNLGEYRTNLSRLRASEYAPQAAAFRAGLEDALPSGVLSLLTWREMEELVCEGGSSLWCLW